MAERQAAHRHGLALRADRVGQIHQPGHEERELGLGGQRRFEARDDEGGDHAADEADQQPRQPVAGAAQRRLLERVARV